MLSRIRFDKFTAFESLVIDLSPGINVFLGENGTGKTHILKTGYAACGNGDFAQKITEVFHPSGGQAGRLVKRSAGSGKGSVKVQRMPAKAVDELGLELALSITTQGKTSVSGINEWSKKPLKAAYIPARDTTTKAPEIRTLPLYEVRETSFGQDYADSYILDAPLPVARRAPGKKREELLNILQEAMDGKVVPKRGELFLKNKHGQLEFTLLAEGHRRLGWLWLLIQNGALPKGSVLFWDEPETNLNPKLMRTVIEALIRLQRMGVQILLATHDCVILHELDLQAGSSDKALYHSLYRDGERGDVKIGATGDYLNITPNAIDDAFGSIIDREIERSMGKLGK